MHLELFYLLLEMVEKLPLNFLFSVIQINNPRRGKLIVFCIHPVSLFIIPIVSRLLKTEYVTTVFPVFVRTDHLVSAEC